MTRAPRVRLALVAAPTAASVFACGSPKPSTLDDPVAVLQKVTERMFAVRTVHLKLNLAEAGNMIGGPDSATAEGDFDIATGELSVAGRSAEVAAAPVEFVIDGGRLFTRTDGPWTTEPVAGLAAVVPPKAAFRAALQFVAEDPRIGKDLRGIAPCPTGDCYTLILNVSGAAGWDVVAGLMRPFADLPAVPPANLPNSSIRVYADVETFDIVQLEVIIDDRSGRIRLVVDASNHDAPIRIDPPSD